MKAAIYARISLDASGEGLGTERQLADCRQLCEERGWTLVEEYVDNDISAYSGRKRPAFERMLKALANQEIDTVIVWKSDRLARRGRDLQRFLDAAGAATLTSCTEPEFTGATGLLMLRIISGFAEHESGVKAERVARKMRSKAENGDPHAGGVRTFGFTADGKQLEPTEAALIAQAAKRILAGETVSAVCSDWIKDQVPTPAGGRWHPSNISRLLRSPKVVGLREYHGELHQGTWPAILDRSTWDRLQAVLGQRTRKAGRKHLLTGLLFCGRCGGRLVGGADDKASTYRCQSKVMGGCGGLSVATGRLDPYVVSTVLASLGEGERRSVPDSGVEALLEALRASDGKMAQLSKDHYVEGIIDRQTFMAAYVELDAQAVALRTKIADRPAVMELDGVAEQWETRSLSWKQSVLKTVLERIDIAPAKSTHAPIEDRVTLSWRA